MSWYRNKKGSVTIVLHIQPGAKRTEVAGLHGDALKIRIAAPAVEGAANAALLNFLKKHFAVPATQIILKHGATGRKKVVEVIGASAGAESLLP